MGGCLDTASLDNDKGASDVSALLAEAAPSSMAATTTPPTSTMGSTTPSSNTSSTPSGGAAPTGGATPTGTASEGGQTGGMPTGSQTMPMSSGEPNGMMGTQGGAGAGGTETGGEMTGAETGAETGGEMTGAETGAETGGEMTGGEMTGGEQGPPAPMPELVAGTAGPASCYSYTRPANGMCGSHCCGVDQATLEKALDPNGACGANNNAGGVAQVCDGGLVIVVGDCARTIKSQPQNLFSDNETLKPLVAQCVYEDPQFTDTLSMECLGCFLDVALCAGNLCLPQCLSGNTPECDQCRKDNNCEQPLFPCAGLPNPL